jgi:serine protease inhibitor
MKPILTVLLSCIVLLMPMAVKAQLQSLVAGNTAFAVNLYGQLATNQGNLFFSPYSISTCLAMTYAGARGNTEAQMSQVLGFGTNQQTFASLFGDLQSELEATQETNVTELNIANALWTQEGFPFLPAFLDTATTQYQASIAQADFITNAVAVTQIINNWVAQETQNKILNILPPGSINSATRLVLANAIYFLGTWTYSFEITNTTTQPFYLSSTNVEEVPLMHQPLGSTKFNYMATTNFQAIELPYGTNQDAMVILLPSQIDGYEQLEQQLSPAFLSGVLAQMSMIPIEIFLPRFTLESSFNLSDTLTEMGMPDAFTPQVADFSGMDGMNDLFLSIVLHKAWGEVNEAGTQAAAATVTGVSSAVYGPPLTPVFRADHPFIFFIYDTQSGSLLFMGRLVDPGQAAAANAVPSPRLVLTVSAPNVILTWPTSPAFTLESASSLVPPVVWTTNSLVPAVVNGQNVVTNPISSQQRFYRIIQ